MLRTKFCGTWAPNINLEVSTKAIAGERGSVTTLAFIGVWWITMITAFGIACVKAYLVITRFMHINLEPPFVSYLVVTALVFMLLFFAGTAPDVMEHEGSNWIKPAWLAEADAPALVDHATTHD